MTDLAWAEAPASRAQPAAVRLDHDTPDLAAAYDRVGLRQFEHGKVLLDGLALDAGDRVLDVGCGTGLLGAWAAGRVAPGGEVIGIDPLPLRVVLARRKQAAGFRAEVGRAELDASARVRERLAERLEARRSGDAVTLERHLVYGHAVRA